MYFVLVVCHSHTYSITITHIKLPFHCFRVFILLLFYQYRLFVFLCNSHQCHFFFSLIFIPTFLCLFIFVSWPSLTFPFSITHMQHFPNILSTFIYFPSFYSSNYIFPFTHIPTTITHNTSLFLLSPSLFIFLLFIYLYFFPRSFTSRTTTTHAHAAFPFYSPLFSFSYCIYIYLYLYFVLHLHFPPLPHI